jgi:Tol biopolymer transport system component
VAIETPLWGKLSADGTRVALRDYRLNEIEIYPLGAGASKVIDANARAGISFTSDNRFMVATASLSTYGGRVSIYDFANGSTKIVDYADGENLYNAHGCITWGEAKSVVCEVEHTRSSKNDEDDQHTEIIKVDTTTGKWTFLNLENDVFLEGDSTSPSVSADGTTLTFTNFTDNGDYVVQKNLVTGEMVRLNHSYEDPKIPMKGYIWLDSMTASADGKKICFDSNSTNLIPNDTNPHADIYCLSL